MLKHTFYLFIIGSIFPMLCFTAITYTIAPGVEVDITELGLACKNVSNHTNITQAAGDAELATQNASAGYDLVAAGDANPFIESPYLGTGGRTIFIATQTLPEWQAFINNPPSGMLVTVCCAKTC